VLKEVEEQLKNNPSDNLIVSISAASNVTSTLTDLKGLNSVISKISVIQRK
jgi:selenocysteine lyase/cysteine desulfurase